MPSGSAWCRAVTTAPSRFGAAAGPTLVRHIGVHCDLPRPSHAAAIMFCLFACRARLPGSQRLQASTWRHTHSAFARACCPWRAGEQQWTLLSTLSGFHDRTIFSVDWSKQGLIASGCADNAIRIFGQEGGGEQDQVDSAAATPGVWGLFMQQDSSRRPATGSSSDKASSSSDSGVATFRLLSTRQPAHPLDVNCVRWHPTDPTLLASAGDDCCIKLWRWHAAPT